MCPGRQGPSDSQGSPVVRDSSTYFMSFNLPDSQSVSQGVSESDVRAHVQQQTPPTAQASSYALICPDGKWAYCMWGIKGIHVGLWKIRGFAVHTVFTVNRN